MRALLILVAGCSTLDIPGEANIADGDTDVAPVAVIKTPLDPDTPAAEVNDTAVTLTDGDGFELPTAATIDSTGIFLEVTPVRPMKEGTTYTLETELRDVEGAPIGLSFTTLANPQLRFLSFVPGTINPTSYDETDDEGRTLFYNDPGPDLVWPSPDDVPSSYQTIEDRVGDTRLRIRFDAGPDGELFTADDTPTFYTRSLFEGNARVRDDRFFPGPDGVIETADDVINQLREEVRNEQGQLTRLAIAVDGGDNIPGSADDNFIFVLVVVYDERGLRERSVQVDAGPDGELLTGDDIIPDGPPTTLYDDRGVYIGSLSEVDRSTNYVDNRGISYREDFFDAGADGELGTPDDRITLRLEYRVP